MINWQEKSLKKKKMEWKQKGGTTKLYDLWVVNSSLRKSLARGV